MENVSRKVGEENAVLAVVFSLDEVRGALKEASAISEYHLIEVRSIVDWWWSNVDNIFWNRVKKYGQSLGISRWIYWRSVAPSLSHVLIVVTQLLHAVYDERNRWIDRKLDSKIAPGVISNYSSHIEMADKNS